jgi:hypothetical protein
MMVRKQFFTMKVEARVVEMLVEEVLVGQTQTQIPNMHMTMLMGSLMSGRQKQKRLTWKPEKSLVTMEDYTFPLLQELGR